MDDEASAVATEARPGDSGRPDDRLDALVNEHSPAAYRVALAVVRDPALAEDVVQETLVKAWRNLDTFRGEGSLRAWVLSIAHNTAVSHLRRMRDVAVDPSELPERAATIGTAQRATGRVAMEALAEALDTLDPASRSIVVLREVEGLSYDVIADSLELPVSTVKTKLFRARKRLTSAMEDWS